MATLFGAGLVCAMALAAEDPRAAPAPLPGTAATPASKVAQKAGARSGAKSPTKPDARSAAAARAPAAEAKAPTDQAEITAIDGPAAEKSGISFKIAKAELTADRRVRFVGRFKRAGFTLAAVPSPDVALRFTQAAAGEFELIVTLREKPQIVDLVVSTKGSAKKPARSETIEWSVLTDADLNRTPTDPWDRALVIALRLRAGSRQISEVDSGQTTSMTLPARAIPSFEGAVYYRLSDQGGMRAWSAGAEFAFEAGRSVTTASGATAELPGAWSGGLRVRKHRLLQLGARSFVHAELGADLERLVHLSPDLVAAESSDVVSFLPRQTQLIWGVGGICGTGAPFGLPTELCARGGYAVSGTSTMEGRDDAKVSGIKISADLGIALGLGDLLWWHVGFTQTSLKGAAASGGSGLSELSSSVLSGGIEIRLP